jgi:enoyl-CoA hydratase/carnithine racemase
MLEFYSSFLSVLNLAAPSIAVLHGAAVGAGLCLAMACDLRLAARGEAQRSFAHQAASGMAARCSCRS